MELFCGKYKSRLSQIGWTERKKTLDVGEFIFPSVVINRVIKEHGFSTDKMEAVEISLLAYFQSVKLLEDRVEMLDKDADKLWHKMLLDTRSYMNFCSHYIGFYIHHEPYIESKIASKRMYDDTKSLYREAISKSKGLGRRMAHANENEELRNSMFMGFMLADETSCGQSSNNYTHSTYDSIPNNDSHSSSASVDFGSSCGGGSSSCSCCSSCSSSC